MFAAAQMCHESAANGGAGLSQLATEAQNYAGLKWSEWERQYGCEPVTYGTWEVLNGQTVSLNDAFCKAPSWEVWLQVYGDLLTSDAYKGALQYRHDPMLYGIHVWQCGWATDPGYIAALAGWMSRLYPDYADTLPMPPGTLAPIKAEGGRLLTTGTVIDGTTWAPVRKLCEAQGETVAWSEGTVVIGWPGAQR